MKKFNYPHLVFLSIIVDIYWWGSVTKILICFAYLRNQAKFLLLD